jgi:hypothetical protein
VHLPELKPVRGYGLWQDLGRSSAGPVHWPLWPAPLPPLVGGWGVANAGAAVDSTSAVAKAAATLLTASFDIETLPPALITSGYGRGLPPVPDAI